jgi:hypothetical protein
MLGGGGLDGRTGVEPRGFGPKQACREDILRVKSSTVTCGKGFYG